MACIDLTQWSSKKPKKPSKEPNIIWQWHASKPLKYVCVHRSFYLKCNFSTNKPRPCLHIHWPYLKKDMWNYIISFVVERNWKKFNIILLFCDFCDSIFLKERSA